MTGSRYHGKMTAAFRRPRWPKFLPRMTRVLAAVSLVACDSATAGNNQTPNADLVTDVVATGLDTVWELAWGPDDFIWMTERGGRISRVNPQTGARTTVGQLDVAEIGEGGLMGLTFHPEFNAEPWVYAAHTSAWKRPHAPFSGPTGRGVSPCCGGAVTAAAALSAPWASSS